jgi:hypothetical protein
MSIMVWQILRRLPKPLLLVALFFLLAAVARAWPEPEKPASPCRHGSHVCVTRLTANRSGPAHNR